MAFKAENFTLSGSAQPLSTVHRPVTFLRIENTTGNADVKVGDSTLTAAIYGFTVTAGPATSKDLGPWGGGTSPVDLAHVYVIGTNGQIIHLTYVPL